uniref:Uncharacterized protein n=1 Tax=Arundo donax TaxID=35708 RepID=A0A0A9GKZ8_ARUDO
MPPPAPRSIYSLVMSSCWLPQD